MISELERFLLPAVFALGCNAQPPGPNSVYPVTGVVTYNGQPVAGAAIVFSCPTTNTAATGATDARGHFRLTTFTNGDGAAAGTHQVRLSKRLAEYDSNKLKEGESPPTKGSRSEIPEKYERFESSGLSVEVTPQARNHFAFTLED